MPSFVSATLIMAALGVGFATLLAVAWTLLRVPEDPRLEAVDEALPGTNCGACGAPGCHAFAEALIEGTMAPGGCTVSSAEAIEEIAELLGVDAGEQVKRVARLACAGGYAEAPDLADYRGARTCREANVVAEGGKACPWGCLLMGDCVEVCTFDALALNDNGLPVVVVDKCTACGDCVEACPRDIFHIVPLEQPLWVQCSSPMTGDPAKAICKVACDACGRCVQDAPQDVIEMVDGLPVIDPDAGPLTPAATNRCPTGAIVWLTERQFAEQDPDAPVWRAHG